MSSTPSPQTSTTIPHPPTKDPPQSTTTTATTSTQPEQQQQQQESISANPPVKEPPRPSFSTPFFTLIHDAGTETTIHPSRVHYIFSDDEESEVLSAACLRALGTSSSPVSDPNSASSSFSTPSKGVEEEEEEGGDGLESSSGSSATYRRSPKPKIARETSGKAPPALVKREERVLILDVNAMGDRVVKAESLSRKWQILHTEIANAPTWDAPKANSIEENEGDGGEEGKGMMLRIEGVGVGVGDGKGGGITGEGLGIGGDGGGSAGAGGGSGGVGMTEEMMHALMEGFEGKMRVLRRVVECGHSLHGIGEKEGKERILEGERIEAEEREGKMRRGENEEKVRGEENEEKVRGEEKEKLKEGLP